MRQSENVVLGSKHRGYIEVSRRNVFADSCVFASRVSFSHCVYVCACLHALAMFSEILALTSLTCEVEEDDYIPRGQLYLHGDP